MAIKSSPQIITDGLVFYYDTDNVHSYTGEPTENLCLNPDFRNSTIGWSISNATSGTNSLDTSIYYSSPQSLKITVSNGGDQYEFKSENLGIDVSGLEFTVSAYIKTEGVTGVWCRNYWMDNVGSWIWSNLTNSNTLTGTNDWTRISVTGTAPTGTYRPVILIGPTVKDGLGQYWIDDVQIEQKSHVTPFVSGSRLTTDALKDLSGNNHHGDLDSVLFDNNADIYFNNSGSLVINCGQILNNSDWTVPFTMEAWVKPTNESSTWRTIIGTYNSYAQIGINSSNVFTFGQNAGGGWWLSSGVTPTINQWYQLVGTFDGSNARVYVNGELKGGPEL